MRRLASKFFDCRCQKSAGIRYVFQGFLAKAGGKFAVKMRAAAIGTASNTRFFVDDGFLRLTSSVRGFNPCSVKLRLGTWRRLLLKTYPAWAGAIRKSGKLSKQFFRNKMCVTLPSMME